MMRNIFLFSVVCILVIVSLSYFFPHPVEVTQTISVSTEAHEKIYPLIGSFANGWKSWIILDPKDKSMSFRYLGPAQGVGAEWIWNSEISGSGKIVFVDETQNQKIYYKQTERSGPENPGAFLEGSIALKNESAGIAVTWRDIGQKDYVPIVRVLRYFNSSSHRSTKRDLMQQSLLKLKANAEEKSP